MLRCTWLQINEQHDLTHLLSNKAAAAAAAAAVSIFECFQVLISKRLR